MFYDPDDYAVGWRRMGAGYAVAVMTLLGFLMLDIVCCMMCPPIQV
ncbi:hypothetical protein SAMN05880590_11930 [Rhizobium sp. RU35A]|nr:MULTISPECIES: hypothetical protein [Rhizobium]SIR35785.1 hypothetical protein SAMN05880590_11930 [Rhizobium sp. RU35A]